VILKRLLKDADVLVENFRPGTMEKHGIGPASCFNMNSGLVYCRISGFGSSGPYINMPSFDTVGQSMSGLLSQMLPEESNSITGPAIADSVTGMYAANAALAGLVRKGITGKGGLVEISMLESLIAFGAEPLAQADENNVPTGPFDRAKISQSFVFTCADNRRIGIHLSSPEKFWEALIRCLDRNDLADDPRFKERNDRINNFTDIIKELKPIFINKTCDEWLEILNAEDVPCAPVYNSLEVRKDPHVIARNIFTEVEHPDLGKYTYIHSPIWVDGEHKETITPPPAVDEHRAEILTASGWPTRST
jgi:crotonobetainyl-CoA:carnitine CoA-transferase CaiB-like acyl-CoA transferase